MASTLDLLDGPAGPDLARAIVAASGLVTVGTWALRRVHRRPGAETTASFEPEPRGMPGPIVYLTDAAVAGVPVPGEPRLRGWVHPDDPWLPALRSALDPAVAAAWLAGAGVAAGHPRPDPVTTDLVAYRPLRRAVVRLESNGRRCYAKLWRPSRSHAAIAKHRLVDAAGIAPAVLATPAAGVLVTAEASGRPLAQHLADHATGGVLPEPSDLIALLDRLPAALTDFPRRAAWSDRLDFHCAAALGVLPHRAARLRALARGIGDVLTHIPDAPAVATHGDFYEANIFVDHARLMLIDLDTAGPGRRSDDLACLLGHLAVLPDLSPRHYQGVDAITRHWASAFERSTDPRDLRARTAGVILSLVAGTDPVHADARLRLAESWLGRAMDAG